LDLNAEVFEPGNRGLNGSSQFLKFPISLLIIRSAFELDERSSVFVLTVVGEHYAADIYITVGG